MQESEITNKYVGDTEQLSQKYKDKISQLVSMVMKFISDNIEEDYKYQKTNVYLNVLSACLTRVIYVVIEPEHREHILQIITDQMKADFKFNDEILEKNKVDKDA